MIFADVRGSTAIAENVGPAEFASLLNRFYEVATKALLPKMGVLDKMIGDEVMAFFIPSFTEDPQATAVEAASAILKGVGHGSDSEPWLPVGVGINYGEAYVGKVGTGEINDFTALGDTVNTAARLQNHAKAGEIVVSESIYSHVSSQYPGIPKQEIELSGKDQPFGVHVITPVG